MQINEIFIIVTIIFEMVSSHEVGNASGFFYQKDNTVYLVTFRHVVCERRPDHLVLVLHTDSRDPRQNEELKVDLYREGQPLFHVHSHPKIDIAVVELDQQKLKDNYVINTLSKSRFLPEKYVLLPGESVFVLGYPRRQRDIFHNLPLARQAMVSSVYGVPFNNLPHFLVDANLHPGMSGSPVLTTPKQILQKRDGGIAFTTSAPIFFLGVYSGNLELVYPDQRKESLGLGAVWYPDLIEEIIESIK